MCPQFTVYVSLRQELYDSIPFLYEDAQKYRDIIETIQWDEGNLRSLVAKRIRYSLPSAVGLTDEECWNLIFAETLQYRKTRSFITLSTVRSIARARSFSFAPMLLKKAARAELSLSTMALFPQRNWVIRARAQRISQLNTELQYPGLASLFEVFRGLVYTLERSDLETILPWNMYRRDQGLERG